MLFLTQDIIIQLGSVRQGSTWINSTLKLRLVENTQQTLLRPWHYFTAICAKVDPVTLATKFPAPARTTASPRSRAWRQQKYQNWVYGQLVSSFVWSVTQFHVLIATSALQDLRNIVCISCIDVLKLLPKKQVFVFLTVGPQTRLSCHGTKYWEAGALSALHCKHATCKTWEGIVLLHTSSEAAGFSIP